MSEKKNENETQDAAAGAETRAFEAETRQLLDIVIHSLYSNKEIFLRELISNASDALDRRRFESVQDEALLPKDTDLDIHIETDDSARTLEIADSGIGMSRDEVVRNIGTIAKSGTREVLNQMQDAQTESADAAGVVDLIGQFGVGFYSAFMVAERVELVTRRAGEDQGTRWTSTGDGTYTVEDADRDAPGTTITLHLKAVDEDAGLRDFTDFFEVQRVVKRYSDFVAYPVKMEQRRETPVTDDDGKPVEGKMETVVEDVILNSMRPIWTRPKSEVEDEEYNEFYRHIAHDWNPPLDVLSLHAEGRIEYQALLFLPESPPFDMFYRDQQWGLQLYVRRVLIKDRFEDLLPVYLRFVRGLVDSPDLPLNVSRELVQQDRHITQIRRWLTRKVLDHLKTMMAANEESYSKFWNGFGRVLKEGVSADADNKDRLLPLLRFPSSHHESDLTSLADYVSRMKPDQEHIYYLTAESRGVAESSPHIEGLRAREYEVLYLLEPVDELVVQSLKEFEEKPLRSAAKGTVELGSEDEKKEQKEKLEEKAKDLGDLLKALETPLETWVKEVRLTERLTASPACLVGAEHDMSPQFERMMRQIEGAPDMGPQKRILELNPEHDLIATLGARYGGEGESDEARLADDAYLLYGYALLAEGSELPDPARFSKLLAQLMTERG